MNTKEEFSKLYSRYLKKFYLKTSLVSLVISLAVLLVLSLSFWIIGSKLYWISFVAFGVTLIASFVILYFTKKPTEKEFYSSLEELGLEQRAITMYEYMNDDSLMAKIQRENAKTNIHSKDHKLLKITAPLALIITVAVVFALSLGTAIASGLSAYRIIPSAAQVINKNDDALEDKEYEVTFEVIGDGYIDGDIFQIVKEGEDATGVYAEAEEGWFFYSWGVYDNRYDKVITDDSNEVAADHDPYREVKNVTKNVTYYAVFMEVPEDQESSDDPSDEQQENQAPQEPSNQQSSQPSQSDPGSGGGAGGKYEDYNQVIDGETYYGDNVFDEAYADAMEQMQNEGNEDGDEIQKIISDYYENIEK